MRSRSPRNTTSRRSASSSRCCTASVPACSSTSSDAASTSSWPRRTGRSGTATSCAGSPSVRRTFSSCYGISCATEFEQQQARDQNEREVAGKQVPGPRRRVIGRKRPVVPRKPRLRQAEREEEQGAGVHAAPAPYEGDERHDPDQILRREHPVERYERGGRGGRREQHRLAVGVAASREEDPDRHHG